MSAHSSLLACLLLLSPIPLSAQDTPRPPAADQGWLQAASERVQREEYHFAPRPDSAWTAPNRAQGLRVRIADGWLEAFPRATDWRGEGAAWKVRLRTASFGRVDQADELPAPIVSVAGGRATLDRGGLVEWIVNDERGIEQGWDVHTRPPGDGPLWIGLAVEGELAFRIEPGGTSAKLDAAAGETLLRYGGLRAWDASGRELSARLSNGPDGPGIRVDDAGATYPLTVDPILSSAVWTTESNQMDARFGWSVSSAGDVNGDGYSDVIVSAVWYDDGENNEGRVFGYHGSASGLSTTEDWFVDGNLADAEFGWSISLAGDVNGDGYGDVIVGADRYTNGETDEGAAFVFLGSSSGLSTTPAWSDEGNQLSAMLGTSVGTAGDVNGDGYSDIVVGAPLYDDTLADEGRAYLYLGSASGPSTTPDWMVSGGVMGARYGISAFTAGDVNGDGFDDLAVGADLYDNGQAGEGAAFVYLGSGSGPSTTADWSIEGGQVTAELGASVHTAGDVNGDGYADLVVGLPGYSNGQNDEGRALLFLGGPGGLALTAAWAFETNNAGSRLGTSVGTAGDINGDGRSEVVVGAPNFTLGQADEGAIGVFLGTAGGLELTPFNNTQSNQVGAMFGYSVGTAGDTDGDGFAELLVGAWGWDAGEPDEGRAFLFRGSAEEMPLPTFTAQGDQVDANLGASVACAGDVNGDGFADIVFGAPNFDNGEMDEGRAFLHLGSATGVSLTPDWTAESDQAGALFGTSVARAGDVNGDGYDEVVVGAPGYTNTESGEGRAYLYLGSSSGLSTSSSWTFDGGQMDAALGTSVAGAGDANGDGLADVLVGSPTYDDVGVDDGRALLFEGSLGGLSLSPSWDVAGPSGSNLGASVAGAGDVDGDGYSDVVVGAPRFTNGQNAEGAAFLYPGSSSGPPTTATWSVESNQVLADFGRSVASGGDVNGDGYSDVMVGARAFDNTFINEGRALAYFGSSTGPSTTADWIVNGGQTSAFLGASVAGVGDVNGDGYGDVIVGAPQRDNGQMDEGQAFLFVGGATGPGTVPDWVRDGNQIGRQLGASVAGAGDVDGDGYADVLIGSPFFDLGEMDEGSVNLFNGNDARGGWIEALRQRRADDSAPIALLGISDDPDTYRILVEFPKSLAAVEWAAPGVTMARLEWESKPLDVPFDGTGLAQSAGQAVSAGNLPLSFNEVVTRTGTGTLPEHWRARIVTDNPLMPATAWFSLLGTGPGEAKLRFPADSGGPPKFYIQRKDFTSNP